MSTVVSDINPLLISNGNNSSYSTSNESRKWMIIVILFIIIIVAVFLVAAFLSNIWPFEDRQSSAIQASTIHDKAGVIGKWPVFGGGIANQQKYMYPSQISKDNIEYLTTYCHYNSSDGNYYNGYITVDDNHAYFADYSGFITCIKLDSCHAIWSTNIAEALGYDPEITIFRNRQSVTLYQDSNGNKGCLMGTPNHRQTTVGLGIYDGCYILAVHANNGSFWWSILLGKGTDSAVCNTHGFMINGKYAFGGMSIGGYNNELDSFRGKFFKVNIDTQQIENIWYSFPKEKSGTNTDSYRGSGSWNFPALIDKYVVLGTSNLLHIPDNIIKCIQDPNNFEYDETHYNVFDGCGYNRVNNKYWRCLERNIYPSSLIILEQDTFNLQMGVPLCGVDVWQGKCQKLPSPCPEFYGFDYDLAAVAAFTMDGKHYAAAHAKSGYFYVFEIESKQIHLARYIGGGYWMGGNKWSLAIDEENLIAILSNHGNNPYDRQIMADGTVICSTGNINGVDLRTGRLLYQIVNPYGYINDSVCDGDVYSNVDYADNGVNQSCVYGEYLESENDDIAVYIPFKTEKRLPLNYQSRAYNIAPLTISNEMIFIPLQTGDILIHDILNGEYLTRFQCPDILIDQENDKWDRSEIKGGVTVINDRIIFYCDKRDTLGLPAQIIIMKLNEFVNV